MPVHVNPDWWKTLFDELYLLTDSRSVMDPEVTRREIELVCELLPIKPGQRLLDLCGGHGRHSLELARQRQVQCTVFDYSSVLLEKGRKNAGEAGLELEFVQGDARSTGLPEAHFDHVLIMGNSLGYLMDREADLEILSEAWRVLCSGGWLLVDVTDGRAVRNEFRPRSWHEVEPGLVVCRERELMDGRVNARELVICKERGLIRDCTYSIKLYEPEELAALLKEAGFERVKVHTRFSPHSRQGDYGFMNQRMIAVGCKPEKED